MFKHASKAIFGLIALVIALVWAGDLYQDQTYKLAVVAPAPLYSLGPHEYPKSNPQVATLQPGEKLRVLRMRYGKDFQAFRVEIHGGQTGWVVSGQGIKVVSHG